MHEDLTTTKRPGPIVVACHGASCADGLFGAARVAAAALDARVEVVRVCEPTPLAPAFGGGMHAAPELDAMRKRLMLDEVRRLVSVEPMADPTWSVDVELGAPPETLARVADTHGASLMIMGIGRHNPLDRLLGTETTLATLRHARVPILAVGNGFSSAPQRAVVGMDFSPASLCAARMALQLLGARGRMTLVHVRPRFDYPSEEWRAWDQEYARSLVPLFADAVAKLAAPRGVDVETATVRGDPAGALLAYAQQSGADLLALGTQRHGVLERLLIGSVATRVLRNTRIATIVAPSPQATPTAARVAWEDSIDAWRVEPRT
jgi:nucleotide-binding universal stress UspA family protein